MMHPMTTAQRTLQTLQRTDPEFRELVDVLYGGDVNADEIYADLVHKASPSESRERTERRVAQASNVVGIGAGIAGLGAAATSPALRSRAGSTMAGTAPKLLTRKGKLLASGAAGLQAANLAGDAITARVLGRSGKKDVAKATIPMPAMVAGQLKRVMPQSAGKLYPTSMTDQINRASTQVSNKATAQRKAVRDQKIGQAIGSPGQTVRTAATAATSTGRRQAATGAGLLATGGVAGQRRSSRRGEQVPPMYGMSPYAKADSTDVVAEGTFSKFDLDKRLAFGWASVVEKDGMPVVDRQGDFISPEDMEDAAYVYVQKSRVGGTMHERTADDRPVHVSDLVESVVFTREKIEKMGLPDDTPIGWWVGFKIHDDATWESVKKGEHTGFSIHGRGRRTPVGMDRAMGYA